MQSAYLSVYLFWLFCFFISFLSRVFPSLLNLVHYLALFCLHSQLFKIQFVLNNYAAAASSLSLFNNACCSVIVLQELDKRRKDRPRLKRAL